MHIDNRKSSNYGDVTFAGKGVHNLGLCSALYSLSAVRDLYRASSAVKQGLGSPRSHPKGCPIWSPLSASNRHWGPFLTRVPTEQLGRKNAPP